MGTGAHTSHLHARGATIRRTRDDPWVTLAASWFAVATVAGISLKRDDTFGGFTSSFWALLLSLVLIAVLTSALYAVLTGLFRWLDRRDRSLPTSPQMSMVTAMDRSFARTWAVLAGVWFGYALIHFPGVPDSDTITQLLQWSDLLPRSDHHPWFDTMIFGWFVGAGKLLGNPGLGMFAYVTAQIAAWAAGVSLILCYLTKLGLTDHARRVLTLIAALSPATLPVVITMSKDSFSTIFLLPFLVLYAEALRTRGRVLSRPGVAVAALLICSLLVLSKRTNLYLVAVCIVVLLCVCAWRRAVALVAGGAVVAVLTQGLWAGVVLPAWHVKPPTANDLMTLPTQQTARIAREHGAEIPLHERQSIDAVLRWDGLGQAYVPRRSDKVKGRWKDDATSAQKAAYFEVWFDQVRRYPAVALSATAANTFEYFAPVSATMIEGENRLWKYVPFWKSRAKPTTTTAQIEQAVAPFDEPAALRPLRRLTHALLTVPLPDGLLIASKAFYASWLPLLLLIAAIRRRNAFQVACCVPLLMNLAFLFAGPIALSRYLIPAVMFSTFVVGLMLTRARWEPRHLATAPSTDPDDRARRPGVRAPQAEIGTDDVSS